MSNNVSTFNVRVTGILVEDDKILLVKQKVSKDRGWSLPGGRVEGTETFEEAIIREMKEETGFNVECQEFLYLCEKLDSTPSIIHLTFKLRKKSGEITLPTNEFDENPISDVKFFSYDELEDLGFSAKFADILKNDFPQKGSYMGSKKNIGL